MPEDKYSCYETSFPMYNLCTEVSKSNDIIREAIQSELFEYLTVHELRELTGNHLGQHCKPDVKATCSDIWESPNLLWTQICGLPLGVVQQYRDLVPIGCITYSFDGCANSGAYSSHIIVKASEQSTYPSLAALSGARLAINEEGSWSGCSSLRCAVDTLFGAGGMAASRSGPNPFFSPDVLVTGSHLESIRAVRRDPDVQCAAIDAITWGVLKMHRPHELEGLVIIGSTECMPAPPMVVRQQQLRKVSAAVSEAMFNVFTGTPRSLKTLAELRRLHDALGNVGATGFIRVDSRDGYVEAFTSASLRAARVPIMPCKSGSLFDRYFHLLDSGGYVFKVDTNVEVAQQWMSRAMLLLYGFQFEQARDAFQRCLDSDPDCVMAHWGMVAASSVNYNYSILEDEDLARCRKHIAICKDKIALGTEVSPLTRRLCDAMAQRCIPEGVEYPCENKADTESLLRKHNIMYAEAMRSVFFDCRAGHLSAEAWMADVASLFVEALMNIRPWKMWPLPQGQLQNEQDVEEESHIHVHPDTLLAQRVLEGAFAAIQSTGAQPHPGVCHFYVHLMEMCPLKSMVKRAIPHANILRRQWPACGHLLHMASHIDIQVGGYFAGTAVNIAAIIQDDFVEKATAVGRCNSYHGYRLHNQHMLVYCAMFLGKYDIAIESAEAAIAITPTSLLDKYLDFLEPYVPDPWHVLIRFGRWHEVLARSLPSDTEKFSVTYATGLYARGLALAALGRVKDASDTRSLFEAVRVKVPSTRVHHNVPCSAQLSLASKMLEGELNYRVAILSLQESASEEVFEAIHSSINCLWKAAEQEDMLPYDEPWGWMIPVRHAIGALALEAASLMLQKAPTYAKELLISAERAYREDLSMHPDNVWGLLGLNNTFETSEAFASAGISAISVSATERKDLSIRLSVAREQADEATRDMKHSCFCARGLGTPKKSKCCIER